MSIEGPNATMHFRLGLLAEGHIRASCVRFPLRLLAGRRFGMTTVGCI